MNRLLSLGLAVILLAISLSACTSAITETQNDKPREERLYENKTSYIGDNSKVGALVSNLTPIPEDIKYQNFEIQSQTEPYGLTVNYSADTETMRSYDDSKKSLVFERHALILYSLIDNLGEIHFSISDGNNTNNFINQRAWAEEQMGGDVRDMVKTYVDFCEYLSLVETHIFDLQKGEEIAIPNLNNSEAIEHYSTLPTGKGLDLYAFTKDGELFYGLRLGTNRMTFEEELEYIRQNPLDLQTLKSILSTYPKDTFISLMPLDDISTIAFARARYLLSEIDMPNINLGDDPTGMKISSGDATITAIQKFAFSFDGEVFADGVPMDLKEVAPTIQYVKLGDDGLTHMIDGKTVTADYARRIYNESFELLKQTDISKLSVGKYIISCVVSFEEPNGNYEGYEYVYGIIKG